MRIHSYRHIGHILIYSIYLLCFSGGLFKSDSTWGCMDQTRRWQDHRRLLHVTTDVAAALSWRQVDRRRLQLQPRYVWIRFLANVNSRSRSLYAIDRTSVCRLPSVTFVRPTQTVQIFRQYFYGIGTLAIHWHLLKISRRSSKGNPSVGGVKHKRGSQV